MFGRKCLCARAPSFSAPGDAQPWALSVLGRRVCLSSFWLLCGIWEPQSPDWRAVSQSCLGPGLSPLVSAPSGFHTNCFLHFSVWALFSPIPPPTDFLESVLYRSTLPPLGSFGLGCGDCGSPGCVKDDDTTYLWGSVHSQKRQTEDSLLTF